MAVTVVDSKKRGLTAFVDDPFPVVPHLAKRGRCAPSADATVADLGLSLPLEFDPLDALQLIFPEADPEVLRNYFEASENVLDAAIRDFKEYQLASRSTEASSSNGANDLVSSEVAPAPPTIDTPTDSSEWAELFVREMSSAADLVDAKNRAFRTLELFKKSITEHTSSDATQKMQETLKLLGALLHQNGILKRAFLIQHNRLKDYDEKAQELFQSKQIIEKYQEQIKALQAKNYALSFHLEQVKLHSSISGQCKPDVF